MFPPFIDLLSLYTFSLATISFHQIHEWGKIASIHNKRDCQTSLWIQYGILHPCVDTEIYCFELCGAASVETVNLIKITGVCYVNPLSTKISHGLPRCLLSRDLLRHANWIIGAGMVSYYKTYWRGEDYNALPYLFFFFLTRTCPYFLRVKDLRLCKNSQSR